MPLLRSHTQKENLEQYATGQAVVLDEDQTDTQNIKFTNYDVIPLKVSHIVKYLLYQRLVQIGHDKLMVYFIIMYHIN